MKGNKLADRISRFYGQDDAQLTEGSISFLRKYRFEITLFLIAFLINAVYSMFMTYPIFTDEYVTMAEGIFLSGNFDWSTAFASGLSYYFGYGYSVLYGWLTFFTSDMETVFRCALLLNALFIAFIPVFAYKILFRFLKVKPSLSFLIALCTALFPAYIIVSKYATNDTMLMFLPWVILYISLYLFHAEYGIGRSVVLHCVLAALSCYAYAVHGRGLVLLGASFLFILIIYLCRKKWKMGLIPIFAFVAVVFLMLKLDSAIKQYVIESFLSMDTSSAYNTIENAMSVTVPTAFSPMYLKDTLQGFLNQSFYVVSVTFGFAVVAVAVFAQMAKNIKKVAAWPPEKKNLFFSAGFICMVSFLTILVSAVFFSPLYITDEASRGEYYIYGRYNESICAMLIFVVLAFFARKEKLKPLILKISIVVLAAFLLYGILRIPPKIMTLGNNTMSYSMVSSIMPFLGAGNTTPVDYEMFIRMGCIVGAIFALLMVLIHKKKLTAAILVLIVCFIFSMNYSMFGFIYGASKMQFDRVRLLGEYAEQNKDLSAQFPHVYLVDAAMTGPRIQFAMPTFDLQVLDVARYGMGEYAKVQKNSLIISGRDEYLDLLLEDVYQMVLPGDENDPDASMYVCWVYGEELMEELQSRGYAFNQRNEGIVSEFVKGDGIISSQQEPAEGEGGEDVVEVGPHQMQYGPYMMMPPGDYLVTVSGENLDCLDYAVTIDYGAFIYRPRTFVTKTENMVQYTMSIDVVMKDVEFISNNPTDDTVAKIYSLKVEQQTTGEKQTLEEAENIVVGFREYTMETSRSFKEKLKTTGEAVKAQTGVLLNRDAAVLMEEIILPAGKSALQIFGDRMAGCEYQLITENGEVVQTREMVREETSVTFLVDLKQLEKNMTLRIVNASDADTIVRSLRIVYLEDEGTVFSLASGLESE